MKLFFLLSALVFTTCVFSQEINIIPQPVSIKQPKIAAKFSINPATEIVLEGSNLEKTAAYFNDYLKQFYLFRLKVVKNSSSKNVIRINYERLDAPVEGAYLVTVDNKGIYIAGDNEAGVFYGIQTLIQLLPIVDPAYNILNKLDIPYVSIEDQPRFAYRGMHLDVCRHFFPVSYIKKYINYLALHKLNTFHWHLTEDQGWRIEIKKYPKLTSVGGYRNGTIIGHYPGTGNDGIRYGGYYTQEEIKDVVKYAATRFITVIPEIEMPGHSSAAIAAYPWLSCFPNENTRYPKECAWHGDTTGKQVQQTWGVFEDIYCAGKDSTFTFLKNVLDEVMQLFPSKYIHVGGDESPKENWKRCPLCQQRIKNEGLKDEHELQSYFIQRIEKYLNSKGRTLIGWDEILEGGLAPNAVVMSWRGEEGGIVAAKQKHNVIMSPENPVYFDRSQSENEDSLVFGGYNPIEKVYAYDPAPKELNAEEAKYILGAQANVWTEYMTNTSKVEYMIFPRMAALSEVLWSQKEKRNDFEKRLQSQLKRYDLWKANYSKAYFDLESKILPTENNQGVIWELYSKCENCKINLEEKFLPEFLLMDSMAAAISKTEIIYDKPVRFESFSNESITAHLVNRGENKPDTLSSISLTLHFNKATGKKITLTTPASAKYPGDGAFTLVNGVQNEKGLVKSNEFLGFEGTGCEAIIDLGKKENISSVTVHALKDEGDWIWRPLTMEVFTSDDGTNFTSIGLTDDFEKGNNGNGTMSKTFTGVNAKYIKVKIENWGTIPEGNPGAGNKPWLFVDEIEVN